MIVHIAEVLPLEIFLKSILAIRIFLFYCFIQFFHFLFAEQTKKRQWFFCTIFYLIRTINTKWKIAYVLYIRKSSFKFSSKCRIAYVIISFIFLPAPQVAGNHITNIIRIRFKRFMLTKSVCVNLKSKYLSIYNIIN